MLADSANLNSRCLRKKDLRRLLVPRVVVRVKACVRVMSAVPVAVAVVLASYPLPITPTVVYPPPSPLAASTMAVDMVVTRVEAMAVDMAVEMVVTWWRP